MAKWIFTRTGAWDYPTLGFTATSGDVIEADLAPDAWWDETDAGAVVTIPVVPAGGVEEPAGDSLLAYNAVTNRGEWKSLATLGLDEATLSSTIAAALEDFEGGGITVGAEAPASGWWLDTSDPNLPPEITTFTLTPDGLDVEATWSATDPDGDPLTAVIDWGDGAETDPATTGATHTYATDGTYTVTLTVTDGQDVDTAQDDVTVEEGVGPSAYATEVLADNPYAYIRLDGDATDYTGNTTPSSQNLTYTTGIGDGAQAGVFNGTNTKVEIASTAWDSFTLEAIIKPSAVGSQDFMTLGDIVIFRINASAGLTVLIDSGGYQLVSSTGITFVVGTTYHVAVVHQSGAQKLFVNGIQRGAGTVTKAGWSNVGTIGSRMNGSGPYDGVIAGAVFTKAALSDARIAAHAAAVGA